MVEQNKNEPIPMEPMLKIKVALALIFGLSCIAIGIYLILNHPT